MPAWLVVVVAVATPVLAFVGSFGGQLLSRRSARELDLWRRREETMRMLRWAAELAADADDQRASMGVATLSALAGAELLQEQDRPLLEAIASTVVGGAAGRYDEETIQVGGRQDADFVVGFPTEEHGEG